MGKLEIPQGVEAMDSQVENPRSWVSEGKSACVQHFVFYKVGRVFPSCTKLTIPDKSCIQSMFEENGD